MNTFSNSCEFADIDSIKNTNFDYNDGYLTDFNLNDFYKSVMNNKVKKSRSESSLLCNSSKDNFGLDSISLNDELSKEVLTYKRSRLLNKLGSYKSLYSSKMGIVEYLLHSYVILFTPNPVTVYSYEAVFKNMSPESEDFWKTVRTLTSVHLDVDKFPNNVPRYISSLLESKDPNEHFKDLNNKDSRKLDLHFTWLCKCCINVTNQDNDEVHPEYKESYRHLSDSEDLKSRRTSISNQLLLNNIFTNNYDLSSDVLYEALKQRGNRFVQRSLYNNFKNIGALCSRSINPNVAAKLSESNGRMKRFIDMVQQSSLDSSDPSSYVNYYDSVGDERRHSLRRSMLLRKKYP